MKVGLLMKLSKLCTRSLIEMQKGRNKSFKQYSPKIRENNISIQYRTYHKQAWAGEVKVLQDPIDPIDSAWVTLSKIWEGETRRAQGNQDPKHPIPLPFLWDIKNLILVRNLEGFLVGFLKIDNTHSGPLKSSETSAENSTKWEENLKRMNFRKSGRSSSESKIGLKISKSIKFVPYYGWKMSQETSR